MLAPTNTRLRNIGLQVCAAVVISIVAVVYVTQASLSATPFTMPFGSHVSVETKVLVPEGWAFFTLSPRTPEPAVYSRDASGDWRSVTAGPLAVLGSLMGLDRATRAQGTEIAIIIAQVPATAWVSCSKAPVQCMAGSGTVTVVNLSSHKSVCGEIGIAIQQVKPWAWHDLDSVMPSRVAVVTVRC